MDLITEAAWTAMEVSHPLLPPVVEVLAQGSEVTVVYAYVEAVPLRALLRASGARRRPLAPDVALRLVRDLAEALSALHAQAGGLDEAGLGAFGGFTPDSVLAGTDGRARLTDALVSGTSIRSPVVRSHVDRIAYTAPEALTEAAASAGDPRADVFALGVLLWELLARRRLFAGSGRNLEQQVRSLKIPRLDDLGAGERVRIPSALAAVVAQALERDPGARPQDMAELISAIVDTGADCARADAVGAFVEEVGQGDLERQRNAIHPPPPTVARLPLPGLARSAPGAAPPRPLPGIVRTPPREAARPVADAAGQPTPAKEPPPLPVREATPDPGTSRRRLPPLRRATLLGMAPPKPDPRAVPATPEEAVRPAVPEPAPPAEAARPAAQEPSPPAEAERPAAPVAAPPAEAARPAAPEPAPPAEAARPAAPEPAPPAEAARPVAPEPAPPAEAARPAAPEPALPAGEASPVASVAAPLLPAAAQEAPAVDATDVPVLALGASAVPLVHDHRFDDTRASRARRRPPLAILVIGGAVIFLVVAVSIATAVVRRPAAQRASQGFPSGSSQGLPSVGSAPAVEAAITEAPAASPVVASAEPSAGVAAVASSEPRAPSDAVSPLTAASALTEPRLPASSAPAAARPRSTSRVPPRSAPTATRRPPKPTYVPDGI